jgi:L-alanine-DL-glutamate epimerase-like enolase superfamily enzyme
LSRASLAAHGTFIAKVLEPFGLYWFEEPCWPEAMDDIARIKCAVKTPIATGERLVGLHAFRELLEKRAASVIQPDISHCGGLSEAQRIAALAEAYRVALAPHNPQGPVPSDWNWRDAALNRSWSYSADARDHELASPSNSLEGARHFYA